MTTLNKDLIFFSNHCKYSKEVLALIKKKSLINEFVLINIDSPKYVIPNVVDRVPLIITANKQIATDNVLFQYIESKTKNEDISPFQLSNETIGDSSFSFIDESCTDQSLCQGYTYLNEAPNTNIPIFEDDKNSSSKLDSSVLEKFVSDRDRDTMQYNNRKQF